MQMLVDHAVHPVEKLTVTPLLPDAARRRLLTKDTNDLPELREPRLFDGRGEIGVRLPPRRRGTDELRHALVLSARDLRGQEVVAVRLVDDDGVCELHDALFDALQFVTRTRQHNEQEEIDHRAHGCLGLPDADRLDDDDVVACRLAEQHGLTALARDAAKGAARRRGTDECLGAARECPHARLVAED